MPSTTIAPPSSRDEAGLMELTREGRLRQRARGSIFSIGIASGSLEIMIPS